jgi:hypothetical protein
MGLIIWQSHALHSSYFVNSDSRAKGESMALTVCIDSLLEEESIILLVRQRDL